MARSTVVRLETGKGALRSLFQALSALELELVGRNLPAGERLGAQLSALRRRRGLSVREFAQLIGVAPNTVVSLERHERGIASALVVEIRQLRRCRAEVVIGPAV
jgi:DNA-binding XRE family transcriptional regulator